MTLAAAAEAAHAGTFQFTQLQISGQNNSYVGGLNDNNVVAGAWSEPNGDFHGFVWANGVFTQVDGAGNTPGTTLLLGVNDSGIAVGAANGGNGVFTYDIATGQQTQIVAPQHTIMDVNGISASGTVFGPLFVGRKQYSYTATNGVVTPVEKKHSNVLNIAAISAQGRLLGSYYVEHGGHPSFHPGFTYADAKFKTFYVDGDETFPTFFGLSGSIGGFYIAGQTEYGFVMSGGTTVTYKYPDALNTTLVGQTSGGLVAGNTTYGGYVGHGFLSDGTNYYSYDPPGSTNTTINGVNANGSLAGNYVDSDGHRYGFIAICPTGQAPCTH